MEKHLTGLSLSLSLTPLNGAGSRRRSCRRNIPQSELCLLRLPFLQFQHQWPTSLQVYIPFHHSHPGYCYLPLTSLLSSESGTEIDITKHQHSSSRKVLIGLITVSSVMAIIIVSIMCLWICHRKNIHKSGKIGTKKLGKTM